MVRYLISSGRLLYFLLLAATIAVEVRLVLGFLHRPNWESRALLAAILVGYGWLQFEKYRTRATIAYAWMLALLALAGLAYIA